MPFMWASPLYFIVNGSGDLPGENAWPAMRHRIASGRASVEFKLCPRSGGMGAPLTWGCCDISAFL
jgi:hypothetical protein